MLFASGATERKLDVWVWNGDGGYALAYRDAIAISMRSIPTFLLPSMSSVTVNLVLHLKLLLLGQGPGYHAGSGQHDYRSAESGAVLPLSNYLLQKIFQNSTMQQSQLQYEGEDYMAPSMLLATMLVTTRQSSTVGTQGSYDD